MAKNLLKLVTFRLMLNLIIHKIIKIVINYKKINPFPYKLQSWAQRRSKVLLAETTVSSRYEVARSVTLRNEKPSTTKKTFLTPQPQKKIL